MLQFAGQDLTNYFPQPMNLACPGLVTSDQLSLMYANFTPTVAYAVHTSGTLQTIPNTKLNNANWYKDDLQPTLEQHLKGDYVYTKGVVQDYADNSGK
jgi:chitin synthase